MISNERSSAYGGRPSGSFKRPASEDTLRSEKLQIERKVFLFALKENPRGRFVRVTEEVSGHRDSIIIPATGLEDFKKMLDQMKKAAEETKPKTV